MKKLFMAVTVVFVFSVVMGFSFNQAPEDSDGKKIFVDNKCTTCHSVDSEGVVSKAKKRNDLSGVGLKNKSEALAKFITKKEAVNGKKHAVAFKGSDEDLKTLTTWLESLKTVEKKK